MELAYSLVVTDVMPRDGVDGLSIWHWLVVLLLFVPWIWACARILRRMGFSGWWAAISWITPLNLIGLIVRASKKWLVEGRG